MSPTKMNVDNGVGLIQENNKVPCDQLKKDEFKIVDDGKVKEEKLRIEMPLEEELLGSVTTLSSPAVRTSARVIQKMKMDSIRPASPPISEKKDTAKEAAPQKTPVQPKPSKVIWTNIERNLFFEAINECGKDFDAISHYINLKQRRKSAVIDPTYKTKDHVRLLYYQTVHKVSKYLRFSDEIKKNAQELYGLINYGEMRKKLVFINQKACMKLKELVYKGSVTVRVKGKNIRIKTPSCKTLRKLNQLEEWQEEIQLPLRVDVYLRPANTDAWGRVQGLAQNPRVKTILPLQKRVLSLLKTLQARWRSRDARLCEQTMALTSGPGHQNHKHSNAEAKHLLDAELLQCVQDNEPILRFAPTANTVIHRPMVNLAEFLSSYSICLNSYEDRIGVTVKGEQLCNERLNTLKELIRASSKRPRHDSGGDKKSPDHKRPRSDITADRRADKDNKHSDGGNSSTDDGKKSGSATRATVSDDFVQTVTPNPFVIEGISEIDVPDEVDCKLACKIETNLMDISNASQPNETGTTDLIDIAAIPMINPSIVQDIKVDSTESLGIDHVVVIDKPVEQKPKKKETKSQSNKKKETKKESFRPLLNDETIREIKKGWNLLDVGDLTIGDLYIMFGQDFRVNLEYSWMDQKREDRVVVAENGIKTEVKSEIVDAAGNSGSSSSSTTTTTVATTTTAITVAATATTTPSTNVLGNKLKQLLMLANLTEKSKKKIKCSCSNFCDTSFKTANSDEVLPRSFISNKIYPSSHNDNGLFRQPVLPSRNGVSHMDAYRMSLNHSRNKQTRWIKARNSRPSRQVVVQRLLPLQPGITHSYDVVTTSNHMDFVKPSKPPPGPPRMQMTKRFETHDVRNNKATSSPSIHSNNNNHKETTKKQESSSSAHKQPPPVASEPKRTESGVASCSAATAKTTDMLQDEDPGIQSLMEISLPSPGPSANIDEYFNYNSNPPMSPMTILRQSPTDPKWFEENENDFSLSSFLGHLDACEGDKKSSNHEIESSNMSTMSETSIDYMSKFEELAQSMINQDKHC